MGNTTKIKDQPTSEKQLRIAQWFADYKATPLPPEVSTSYFKWWGWLHANITQIDREDAHAVSVDFALKRLDDENPVDIIAKLKYGRIAEQAKLDNAELAALKGLAAYDVEMQLDLTTDKVKALIKTRKISKAKDAVLKGAHPDDAKFEMNLADDEMTTILQEIYDQYPEFEIDWGSH
jgi:hypothetical protein